MDETSGTSLPIHQRGGLTLVLGVLVLLLIAAIATAGYFYFQATRLASQPSQTDEIKGLVAEIGETFVLPEGEEPTLATVTDKEKLAGQAFFEKAENGDKVLIYSNAGRAILYRPSAKKIVDTTTVNVNSPPAETTAPAETTPAAPASETPAAVSAPTEEKSGEAPAISVLNGGGVRGSAGQLADNLKSQGYVNVAAGNTEKNYTGATIYYAIGLEQEAEALTGPVGEQYPNVKMAPADPSNPETTVAPLTIILGK